MTANPPLRSGLLAPHAAVGYMIMDDIKNIRLPDEIIFAIDSFSSRFPKDAELSESGISVKGLTPEEQLAVDLMPILSMPNEIIENINIVMSDLDALSKSPRAFSDRNPFKRYKLLVRTFFYEFGRFEDAFGYFTLWVKNRDYLNKKQRREMMNGFYEQIENIVKIRNIYLHDDPSWEGSMSNEIAILEGCELFGMYVKDKQGNILKWEDHLSPLCSRFQEVAFECTSNIRTAWNTYIADLVCLLVQDGKFKKAKKPFIFKNKVYTSTKL